MALQVNYDNTTGAAASVSEPFDPETNFIVQAVGTVSSNVQFQIQQAPRQEPTGTPGSWTDAEGQNTMIDSSNAVSAINFASGFKYRISKNAQNQTSAVRFYWGHTTVLQSAYRND